MNYFLPFWSSPDYRQTTDRQTDYRKQTETDAYEPTVQVAQVGSKMIPYIIAFTIREMSSNSHSIYTCSNTTLKLALSGIPS